MKTRFLERFPLFFLAMLGVVTLLNVNYAILRSARNALAVVDLGGGAGSIPWFELCGTMPGAVLMTLLLSIVLRKFPISRVFVGTLAIFVSFFLLFSFLLYPALPSLLSALSSFPWIQSWLPYVVSLLYFVMAELWKIALLTVLFWGMINMYVPLQRAKSLYAPLMLGGSVGTILAGPLVSLCTSHFLTQGVWSRSLHSMMCVVCFVSVVIWALFHFLQKELQKTFVELVEIEKKDTPKMSLWEGILTCMESRYLLLLAWITMADYIAYALGEIVFLDIAKQKFSTPTAYCAFMGDLSLYNGILTAISALFVTPYLLRKKSWVVASMVTPLCLLVTEGAFFLALWHPTLGTNIDLLVILGAVFFCAVRAAKYTLFDTSKEISFLLLPPLEKMQGKLVVDGMCARLGRGSGSFATLFLVQLSGSVLGAAPAAGGLALVIAGSCALATKKLGVLIAKKQTAAS